MTKDERAEIMNIEAKVRETIYILNRYLSSRTLFQDERQALDWFRIRVELVCRAIFHDPAHTNYKLTPLERRLFMINAAKYLSAGSYPLSNIQRGELCKLKTDSYVYTLIDYLSDIQRECMKSETTGILPKEESFDIEY